MTTHERADLDSHHVLDVLLLLDGEATVAALYRALRAFCDQRPVKAARLLDRIEAAERHGWLVLVQGSGGGD